MSITRQEFNRASNYIHETKKINSELEKLEDEEEILISKLQDIQTRMERIKSNIDSTAYEHSLEIIDKYKEQQITENTSFYKILYAQKCIDYIANLLRKDLEKYKENKNFKSGNEDPTELHFYRNTRNAWGFGHGLKDCWFLTVYTTYSSTVEEYSKNISKLRVWLHTFITSDINEKLPDLESIMYMGYTLDSVIGLAHAQVVNMFACNPPKFEIITFSDSGSLGIYDSLDYKAILQITPEYQENIHFMECDTGPWYEDINKNPYTHARFSLHATKETLNEEDYITGIDTIFNEGIYYDNSIGLNIDTTLKNIKWSIITFPKANITEVD